MCRKSVLAALLICCASLVQAETGDLDKPIDIDAGHCVLEKNGVRRCSGGVTISQGTMSLRAERVELRQDAQDNLFVRCDGAPVQFRQRDDSGLWVEAEAKQIDYDGQAKLLRLTGKARVVRGQESASAESLSYDLAREVMESSGSGDGRTRIVIQPRKNQEKP